MQEHAALNRCRGLARALRAPDGGRRHRTGALRPAAGRPRPPAWPRAARPALCGRSARQHKQFAPECDRHRSVRGRHSARDRIHKGSPRREGDRAGQRPARPSTSTERRSHPRARRRVRPAARIQQDDRCSIHGRSPECVAPPDQRATAIPGAVWLCTTVRSSHRPAMVRSRTAAASRRTGSRWKKSPAVCDAHSRCAQLLDHRGIRSPPALGIVSDDDQHVVTACDAWCTARSTIARPAPRRRCVIR